MSHFLLHAARLQDAGVTELTVRLDTAPDRTRIMHVLAPGHPARTFELCGTDRMLEQLEDDMMYSESGPTPEKLQAAIAAHPAARDDLLAWFSDVLLMGDEPTNEDLAALEATMSDDTVSASIKRTMEYAKGLMRGMDIVRNQDAAKAPGSTT